MSKKLLSVFLLLAGTSWAQAPAGWESVSWIAGCWTGTGKIDYAEQWMEPAGGLMLGMSRTLRPGKSTLFEFVRIAQENGKLYYIANPSGQAEASFELVQAAAGEVVFENPQHDFPQRIIYRLQPDGTLLARIEGKSQGKMSGVDFPMKRTQCAGEGTVCK